MARTETCFHGHDRRARCIIMGRPMKKDDDAPSSALPEILTLAMVVDPAAAEALRRLCRVERAPAKTQPEQPSARRRKKRARAA
jgi:hypothetical protein